MNDDSNGIKQQKLVTEQQPVDALNPDSSGDMPAHDEQPGGGFDASKRQEVPQYGGLLKDKPDQLQFMPVIKADANAPVIWPDRQGQPDEDAGQQLESARLKLAQEAGPQPDQGNETKEAADPEVQRRARKIIAALKMAEGETDHENRREIFKTALGRQDATVSAEEQDQLCRDVADGTVTQEQFRELMGLWAPRYIRYPQEKVFAEIAPDSSLRGIVADITLNDFSQREQLTPDIVMQMAKAVPNPFDLECRRIAFLKKIEISNGEAKRAQYDAKFDALGRIFYGSHWDYVIAARSIYNEAHTKYGAQLPGDVKVEAPRTHIDVQAGSTDIPAQTPDSGGIKGAWKRLWKKS